MAIKSSVLELIPDRTIPDLCAELNARATGEIIDQIDNWRKKCARDAERCRQYYLRSHERLKGAHCANILHCAKGQHEVGERFLEQGGPKASIFARLSKAEADNAWLAVMIGILEGNVGEKLQQYPQHGPTAKRSVDGSEDAGVPPRRPGHER